MNKKVLTLCAGFLLAGTLANAQEKHWVKVEDPTLMLFNQAYVVSNLDGDSILSKKTSNYDQAYLIKKSVKDEAGEEDLFYLKGTATNFNIISGAESTGKQGLYTNNTLVGGPYYFNVENAKSTLALDKDGNIKITSSTNPGSNEGNPVKGLAYLFRKESANKGDITGVAEANDYTKYAFWMQTSSPATISDALAVEQTLFLMSGGDYVVVDNGAVTTTASEPGAYNWNAVWVIKGTGLYNIGTGKYLNYASNKWTLSDSEVSFNLNGPIAVVNGKAAKEASLIGATTPLPITYGFTAAETDAKSIVLYTIDGTVVSADGSLVTYNENKSTKTVWTLEACPIALGQYEVRLKNNEIEGSNKYLVLRDTKGKDQYVTIDNITVNTEGKFELPTNGEVLLRVGDDYVTISTTGLSATSTIGKAMMFGLGDINEAHVTVAALLERYGEYFTLKVEYDKDGDAEYETDLTSIFEGELTPVQNVYYNNGNTSYDLANAGETNFMLMNEKNEILVLNTDPETTWSSGNDIHAYRLETISAKDYVLELDKADKEGRAPYYKTLFSFEYTPGTDEYDVESIDAIYVEGIEVGCYLDKQVPVLAGKGKVGSLAEVKITLNPSAVVDAKTWLTSPVYYTVTVKNANKKAQHYGKVLGLEEEGYIDFVAPENVDQTMPEGQFAITYNTETDKYVFENREYHNYSFELRGSDFYEVDMAKNLFAYRDYQYNLMDTLEIAPVKDYASEDGFKRFTAAELNNNTYTIAMRLLNGESLNVVENHNDKHRVGLDEDAATEWRIEMSQVKLLDATDDFLRYVPDTVTVETKIKYYVGAPINDWVTTSLDPTAKLKNKEDYKPATALKICTYILKNTDNNEYLYGYDYQESKGNDYYICDKYENATRIAFKKIGNETLNLVPAYAAYGSDWWNIRTVKEDDYKSYAAALDLSYNKIIGGATSLTGVLKDEQYLYKAPTNDLFVINVAEAPTYKKLAQGDKIIISRLANNDEVIYEAGEFAGISNRAAYKDIKPTLYVDTAYVNRAGNFAYQYLLGVNINRIDTTYECNIPAHGIHKEDTTYGRFLVNMVDSALANKDVHNNKFKYNGEYKLSFVKGYRTNDTLFFTNEAGKVVSSMKIGDANSNIAKFAFKMIDEEANEFVIETGTGYINKEVVNGNGTEEVISEATVPGYLRWVNGNLVVTSDINEAAHFTMEASDKEATANEAISAGNVVVAGTNGAVVVKGAEGKNVIVSTILGKVVANEVVSSDNAQIATPAGIVVVSVDGESFKVVVK